MSTCSARKLEGRQVAWSADPEMPVILCGGLTDSQSLDRAEHCVDRRFFSSIRTSMQYSSRIGRTAW
jgi:hypothetical protein